MKILYISYDGITDPIGQAQIVPYIKRLADKSVNFTLLTFEKKKNFNPQKLGRNISWRRLRYHKNPPVVSTCYDIIKGTIAGIFIAARKKTDIVHARGYVSAAIALTLKRIFGIKFIFDMRGLWPEEKIDAGVWKRGLLYRITKYFEKILINNCDEAIVLTNSMQRLMRGCNKIEVIPTCADIKEFLPLTAQSNRFTVMYFGSLGTFYGLDEMADFYSVLAKYYISDSFFLIITNNPSDSIDRTMRLKDIPEDSYTVRQLAYAQLKESLPQANVSLMFYKRLLSGKGCCPTKFAESLACGLPVVINAGVGDTEEIIKKERVGVVVDEFSVQAYRRAAEELKGLLAEKEALRQRCRAVAERYFSLSEGAERYYRVYQRLLKK